MPQENHNGKQVFLDPPCMYCEHLEQLGKQFSEIGWSCKAYPNGIPYGIWSRSTLFEHDVILPAQEGDYVFKSKVYNGEVISFAGVWSSVKK